MSDFDKEAERQKLREKYERDKEKRQSTQRMSELLLQGATMTNRHCDECGDPIFRYDGQEFCPTCQNAQVAGGDDQQAQPELAEQPETTEQPEAPGEADSAETGESGGESTDVDVAVQTTESTGDQTAETGSAEDGKAEPTSTESMSGGVSTNQQSAGRQSAGQQSVSQLSASQSAAGQQSSRSSVDRSVDEQSTAPSGSGDLAEARASLQRSVVRFARQAENADDPRRAQELLAASREAAEALAALNR